MKKALKSRIFQIVLTAIIFSGISVFATITITADQIEYAPNISVKAKIDDLYTTATTVVTGLNNQISNLQTANINLQSQLDSLTPGASFSFTSSTSSKRFNLGFRPKYISCFANFNNIEYETIIYSYDYDPSHAYKLNTSTTDNPLLYANAVRTLSTFFTINDDGFSWNITNWNGVVIYCAASK